MPHNDWRKTPTAVDPSPNHATSARAKAAHWHRAKTKIGARERQMLAQCKQSFVVHTQKAVYIPSHTLDVCWYALVPPLECHASGSTAAVPCSTHGTCSRGCNLRVMAVTMGTCDQYTCDRRNLRSHQRHASGSTTTALPCWTHGTTTCSRGCNLRVMAATIGTCDQYTCDRRNLRSHGTACPGR
jgi:hypothetical protein